MGLISRVSSRTYREYITSYFKMAPPKFDDLGKAGNDLFEKNYDFGKVKFELKNKNEGMDLIVKGDQSVASSAIKGSVESNFKCSGVDVKKTWHTHNALDIEVAKSGIASGLGKTVLTASFTPDGGVALGKFKQNISKDNFNLNVNSTMAAAPKIGMDAAFAHKNLNVWFSTGYCVKKSACTGKNVAFAMQQGAINAVLKSTCNSDAALTVFNKLNDNSVMAVSANYSSKLAACDLTVSADIDLLNLQGGGHKFGSAF